jgi:hypothetical protein
MAIMHHIETSINPNSIHSRSMSEKGSQFSQNESYLTGFLSVALDTVISVIIQRSKGLKRERERERERDRERERWVLYSGTVVYNKA